MGDLGGCRLFRISRVLRVGILAVLPHMGVVLTIVIVPSIDEHGAGRLEVTDAAGHQV